MKIILIILSFVLLSISTLYAFNHVESKLQNNNLLKKSIIHIDKSLF